MQVYVGVDDGRVWARAKLKGGEGYRGSAERTVVIDGATKNVLLPSEPMLVDMSTDLSNVEDLCGLAHVHEVRF